MQLLILVGLSAIAAVALSETVQVPRWKPEDLVFESETEHDNPFLVPFRATAESDDGASMELWGFYDGDSQWKLRFAPPVEGTWQITTHSTDAELDGQSAVVECVANGDAHVHGGLLIDPDHPNHFVYEDGARHFLSGYECDWLWALPEAAMIAFLDTLAEHGFNHILLNAYAHDTPWATGKTCDGDYGPPPQYAWEGTNDNPDHSRFNLDYWRHYDKVIGAMRDRGIIAHIMLKVYNKLVNWPEKYSPEEELFFRWVIARYGAFPNVIWDFSKETYNEKNLEYKLSRFRLIRELDGYDRLVTCHDDGEHYDRGTYDAYLDFESDQQHSDWHEDILRHRARRECPAVNVEYGYEHGPAGPEDCTYGVVQPPEEVLRRAWLVYMAGGYGAYYYTYTAWDIIEPEHTPPGYAYFKHLSEFFNATGYWAVEPHDELIEPGYCLARAGEEYIVYLEDVQPVTLRVEGADSPLPCRWFNPLTGEWRDGGEVSDGEVELNPPWEDGPAAAHIGEPPEGPGA